MADRALCVVLYRKPDVELTSLLPYIFGALQKPLLCIGRVKGRATTESQQESIHGWQLDC